MVFRINKVNNINTNFHQQGKIDNKRNELLFKTGNNSDGNVYTNDAVKNLFNKLLNYREDVSLLEAAEIIFPDEKFSEISKESLQSLSLYDNAGNISETLELKDESGNNFYLVKYKNGSIQTFFPDDTSTVKENNEAGSNEYGYTNGILQKITLERTDKYGQHIISEYEANSDGYFIGYANEGETLQDVFKNLGIAENSPEAEQFTELNKNNIKSFNNGRVTSFIVGREMLILPQNAISGVKYLRTSPKDERHKFANKVLDDADINFLSTHTEILETNTSWWELSRKNLINNYKIKNPTKEQISQNMLVLQKLNGKNKKLTQGEEITLTLPIEKDIPEKYQCKNYTIENLRKTYPAPKFNIEVSEDGISVTVTDKNGKRITNTEYMTDYTANQEKYYNGLTSTKYDDLGRKTEQIRISPYNLFAGSYRTETYEYKNSPNGIECSVYEDGELAFIRFYENNNDIINDSEPILNMGIGLDGSRYSISDNTITYYNGNNEIIYTVNNNNGKKTSPVADKLYNALKTKNSKEFEKILYSAIDSKYFNEIYDAYNDTYKDLLSDIKKSSFSKSKKLELSQVIKNFIDNRTPLAPPQNTDNYNFTYENNVLTIKNLKNNTIHTIDFNTRFKGFSYEEEREIIQTIFEMPPEAIEDLSIENKKIVSANFKDSTGGTYNKINNYIYLDLKKLSVAVLLHELGHAIDNDGYFFSLYRSDNENFEDLFKKNLAKYKEFKRLNPNIPELYAATDEQEMFAECYAYIMNGNLSGSGDIELFVKYFGENIEMVREMLEQVWQLPDEERY